MTEPHVVRAADAARALLFVFAIFGSACATPRERPGFDRVEELTAREGSSDLTWALSVDERNAIEAQVKSLLGPDLGPDDAVRIALLHNPELQATYERLGFAEADLVEAGLLRNPTFAGAFMPGVGPLSGTRKVEVELTQSVMQLLLMPARKRIEGERFEGAQLDVAARVLDVAAKTRRAWYALVAQRNVVATLRVMESAAIASSGFAERLHAAGNLNELELLRERGMAEEARIARLEAETGLAGPREALVRLLGLRGHEGSWDVPAQLPAIPNADPAFDLAAPDALDGRLDLVAGRRFSSALSEATELQRRWRYVPFVEAGVASSLEPGEGWTVGPALVLEIPIFQQGQPGIARLEAELRRTQRETEALEVAARAAAREAQAHLAAQRTLVERYRSVTIPLRQKTTAQALRHYNYMLIGIFEVLAAKQDEISAYEGYIGAVRDWWTALADLERATGRRLRVASSEVAPVVEGVTDAPAEPCNDESCAHQGHSHSHPEAD
jgi:cobalt-zinc-cadmium efflux system outer membrane protein